jgi:drug/metabolite transporter (DMT)-like permease
MSASHMSGLEWTLLVALSLLWGSSFLFTEIAIADVPPLTVVLGRVGFAALTSW